MTRKKKLLVVIAVLVIAYIAFGVHVYVQGLQSQLSIHICPPGTTITSTQAQMEDGSTQTVMSVPNCPTQQLNMAAELGTAPVVIFGWLPLMIGQMVSG